MPSVHSRLDESLQYINSSINSFVPRIGIILGTGLGGLVKDIDIKYSLDYASIPHFPVSTVEFHHGNLIFGNISGKDAIIMQGRFHYYEGYSMQEVTYPIGIMHRMGVNVLLVSNACGAVNPLFNKGDLMIMRDHINYLFDTPLRVFKIGEKNKTIYDRELIDIAERTALENHIPVSKGVYCSLPGPCLETVSEYRMIRKIGGDVVGMSTIPEALLAASYGFNVLGFSIITDFGFPDSLKAAKIEEIIEVAGKAEPKLTLLLRKIIEKL